MGTRRCAGCQFTPVALFPFATGDRPYEDPRTAASLDLLHEGILGSLPRQYGRSNRLRPTIPCWSMIATAKGDHCFRPALSPRREPRRQLDIPALRDHRDGF
jgi:hypothetical protein